MCDLGISGGVRILTWLNSYPAGEISLSYIDWLMMNSFFVRTQAIKREIFNFIHIGYTLILSS